MTDGQVPRQLTVVEIPPRLSVLLQHLVTNHLLSVQDPLYWINICPYYIAVYLFFLCGGKI